MNPLTGKKAYFPVESLVGLGHFNRAGKIVREMTKAGMDVTVASGTFVDPKRFFGSASLSTMTPYVFKNSSGEFYNLDHEGKRALCANFNEQSWVNDRTAQHIRNVGRLKPDVILTEFWPFDREDLNPEMFAMLEASGTLYDQGLCVASVRDVIDLPQNTSDPESRIERADHEEQVVRILNKHYHGVLVHGDPRFIPLNETFSRADSIRANLVYTGYVIDDLPERRVPDIQSGPILVSCGSGVDAEEMILSFLTAWDKLVDYRSTHPEIACVTDRPVHIVCGPRFFEGAFVEVVPWANKLARQSGHPIRVDRYRNDFTTLLSQAAFSISLAGYNTTLETLALDVPALLIPKYTVVNGIMWRSTEQEYRLQRLQQQHLAHYASPDEVQNAALFAERIVNEFIMQTSGQESRSKLNFAGSANTIASLSAMVEERNKLSGRTISLPPSAMPA